LNACFESLVSGYDNVSMPALLNNCAVRLWESKSQTHKLPMNPNPSLADDSVDAKDCSATWQDVRSPGSFPYAPTILNLIGGQQMSLVVARFVGTKDCSASCGDGWRFIPHPQVSQAHDRDCSLGNAKDCSAVTPFGH
jgi:hypothetical protein